MNGPKILKETQIFKETKNTDKLKILNERQIPKNPKLQMNTKF